MQEQPFEEFLLVGCEPSPAALLASYVAYQQIDQDTTPPEKQVGQGPRGGNKGYQELPRRKPGPASAVASMASLVG